MARSTTLPDATQPVHPRLAHPRLARVRAAPHRRPTCSCAAARSGELSHRLGRDPDERRRARRQLSRWRRRDHCEGNEFAANAPIFGAPHARPLGRRRGSEAHAKTSAFYNDRWKRYRKALVRRGEGPADGEHRLYFTQRFYVNIVLIEFLYAGIDRSDFTSGECKPAPRYWARALWNGGLGSYCNTVPCEEIIKKCGAPRNDASRRKGRATNE